MIVSESRIKIKCSAADVYKIAEQYPKFVDFFTRKEIIRSSDKDFDVAVGMKKFGISFKWEGHGIKHNNKLISFVQTKGLLRGVCVDWIFEDNPSGECTVKIISTLDLRLPLLKRALEKLASEYLIESTTKKILIELKKKSELKSSAYAQSR